MTLPVEKVFGQLIQNLKMRRFWIIQVGPKSNDKCLYMRPIEERHREKRRGPYEDRERDWNDASTAQGTSAVTRNWERQGRILP